MVVAVPYPLDTGSGQQRLAGVVGVSAAVRRSGGGTVLEEVVNKRICLRNFNPISKRWVFIYIFCCLVFAGFFFTFKRQLKTVLFIDEFD